MIIADTPAPAAPQQAAPGAWTRPVVLVDARLHGQARRPRLDLLAAPGWLKRLMGPLLLLALWQIAVSVANPDPDLVPSPLDVAKAGMALIDSGQLQANFWVSLIRVVQGLGIGLTAGTALAVLAGLWRQSGQVLDSTVQVLKAVPIFAMLPLFIIWTGIGEAPKITLIAVSAALPVYVNIYGSIRSVDNDLAEVARVLGLDPLEMVWHLLLPSSLTGFLSGLRISLTSAWLALIFAETVNASAGLGFLMSQAEDSFRMDIIVLVVTVYALVGIAGYGIVLGLERVLLSWRRGFGGV